MSVMFCVKCDLELEARWSGPHLSYSKFILINKHEMQNWCGENVWQIERQQQNFTLCQIAEAYGT